MELQICAEVNNGNIIPINSRGMEEVEVDLININVVSRDKSLRLVGIDKNLYRLTLKSYKNLKKELRRRGRWF